MSKQVVGKRLVTAVALWVCLVLVSCTAEKEAAPGDTSTPASANQERDSVVVVLTATDSTTVFALLTSSHQVDYQSSALGVFVKGIDSVYGTTDAFWVYSVNDSLPQIAADKYMVQPGDTVRWHLRKSRE